MIYFCCHGNIFLFTGSTFLLMLHFRHHLHGGCFHYLFPSWVEIGDNRNFSYLCFSQKGTCTEEKMPCFPSIIMNTLNVCFYCAHKMYMHSQARKNPNGINSSEGRRYITVTLFCKCAMYNFGSIFKI